MPQDATFKHVFSFPFMVEELVRWFVGDLHGATELVESLDFSRLTRVHEQTTSGPAGAKRRRANDIAWDVPFRDRPAAVRDWLRLVLMIEPQDTVDHLMALRVRGYVNNHHLESWRGGRFGATDRLAPVLPIVIHTGPGRWTAATRVIDLVTPTTADAPPPDVRSRRSGLFAGDGYLLLDTSRLAPDDLRHDNAAALLAGLCHPTVEHLPAQAAALRARLDAPPLRELLEEVLAWAQQRALRSTGIDLGVDDMAEVDRLHESGDLEAYFAERRRAIRDQYRKEGVERGIEQGVARGIAAERALLQRLASRKFGGRADGHLAPLLADIADTDVLATVGEWIIDCDTFEELAARLDSATGGGTP